MIRREFLGFLTSLPFLSFLKTKEEEFEFTHNIIGQEINGKTLKYHPSIKNLENKWFGNPQYQNLKDFNGKEFKLLTFPIEAHLYIDGPTSDYYFVTYNLSLDIKNKIMSMKTKDICDKLGYYKFGDKTYLCDYEDDNLKPLVLFGQKFYLKQVSFKGGLDVNKN